MEISTGAVTENIHDYSTRLKYKNNTKKRNTTINVSPKSLHGRRKNIPMKDLEDQPTIVSICENTSSLNNDDMAYDMTEETQSDQGTIPNIQEILNTTQNSSTIFFIQDQFTTSKLEEAQNILSTATSLTTVDTSNDTNTTTSTTILKEYKTNKKMGKTKHQKTEKTSSSEKTKPTKAIAKDTTSATETKKETKKRKRQVALPKTKRHSVQKGNTYRNFIHKVFLSVMERNSIKSTISTQGINVLDNMTSSFIDRLVSHAHEFIKSGKRKTISADDIRRAARVLLMDPLLKEAIAYSDEALNNYRKSIVTSEKS